LTKIYPVVVHGFDAGEVEIESQGRQRRPNLLTALGMVVQPRRHLGVGYFQFCRRPCVRWCGPRSRRAREARAALRLGSALHWKVRGACPAPPNNPHCRVSITAKSASSYF